MSWNDAYGESNCRNCGKMYPAHYSEGDNGLCKPCRLESAQNSGARFGDVTGDARNNGDGEY